jgi:hypothetical protein
MPTVDDVKRAATNRGECAHEVTLAERNVREIDEDVADLQKKREFAVQRVSNARQALEFANQDFQRIQSENTLEFRLAEAARQQRDAINALQVRADEAERAITRAREEKLAVSQALTAVLEKQVAP